MKTESKYNLEGNVWYMKDNIVCNSIIDKIYMKTFETAYNELQDFIFDDPCLESEFDPFSIEWDIGEVVDRIDCYDKEVQLENDEYYATGMLSCGELVDIYYIERK
jgi:hypothetical protein